MDIDGNLQDNADESRRIQSLIQELEAKLSFLQDEQYLAGLSMVFGEDLHLINNRLGAAKMYSRNIADFPGTPVQVREWANRIARNIDEVLDSFDEVRKLSFLPEVDKINIHEMLDTILKSVKPGMHITILREFNSNKPILEGMKRQIGQVFQVIIHNGLRTINDSGTLGIKTSDITINGKEFVEVKVFNTKSGSTISNNEKRPGIGLSWSNLFLKAIGGDLVITSDNDLQTSINVLIPQDITVFPDFSGNLKE